MSNGTLLFDVELNPKAEKLQEAVNTLQQQQQAQAEKVEKKAELEKGQVEGFLEEMQKFSARLANGGFSKGMEQIKERGFEIKAYNIGEPGAFIEKDRKTFVVVPTTMEMKFPKGLIRSKSFLLAISSDMGKTWKFADGAGISKNPGLREKLVPDLPKELEFPKPATPEIIPNP